MSRSRKSRANRRRPRANPLVAVSSCSACYGPVDREGLLMVCQTEGCPLYGKLLTTKHRKVKGLVGT